MVNWYIENNPIWEISNEESEKRYKKSKLELDFPSYKFLTKHYWSLEKMAWDLSNNIFEFEEILQLDLLELHKYYTRYLLNNFQGIDNGK